MSIEKAREFIKRVKNEPDLLRQAACFQTREERRRWARGLGYDFTGEELEQATAELTDEELELVSGGSCCGFTCETDSRTCSWDRP
ncbi:MAG: Nif11-like leader peptide family natural product precursor [Peptococcaceae bacterium]|nr:Nif11-like leader peptide family natural product precursor [Peptococcaceae bacterium]